MYKINEILMSMLNVSCFMAIIYYLAAAAVRKAKIMQFQFYFLYSSKINKYFFLFARILNLQKSSIYITKGFSKEYSFAHLRHLVHYLKYFIFIMCVCVCVLLFFLVGFTRNQYNALEPCGW